MEIVIPELIRVTRNKNNVLFILALILLLLFSEKMTGAALPGKESNLAIEEVFKFKTSIVREALLKTGFSIHYFKKDETIYRLSQNYFVSVSVLLKINRIANLHLIPIGKKIYIPSVEYQSGRLKSYRVKPGDTLEGLLLRFGLELWQFERINQGLVKAPLNEGILLFLPKDEINRLSRPTLSVSIIRPVWGKLTSRFGRRWGRMHSGIDLAAPLGASVRAAASGRVAFTGWNGGYGRFIKINHGKYRTNYGHLSKIMVSNGSYVRKGDLIGLVGATGRAYGSHLHFELEIGGNKVDPNLYLRWN